MAERRYGRKNRPHTHAHADEAAPAPHVTPLFPWIVGAIAFLVYLCTTTPGMQMGDGTELAAAAYVLGIPHPTGYPLYMLLCKLWLIITIGGDPIVRTTVLNGIFMAAAVGITSLILVDLLRQIWQTSADKAMMLWAAAGALTAAFLRFHWTNAVVTEVYALQFLIMVVFTRWVQKIDLNAGPRPRHLLAITICLALGMAHHRLSVTIILPWLAIWWLAWKSHRASAFPQRLPWLWAAAILVVGAAFYSYIPLRASANPPINWGDADTFSRFYNHVRGTEYLDRGLLKPALGQSFSSESLTRAVELQSIHLLTDLAGQFFPVTEEMQFVPGMQKIYIRGSALVILLGLIIDAIALWGIARVWTARHRYFAATLLAIALQNVAVLYVYNIVDIRDYFLYPFWAAWLGVFTFAAWMASRISAERRLVYSYIVIVVPVFVAMGNWSRCNRNNDISAEVLSATILPEKPDTVPANSILITDDDSETFTTWYRQKVRHERTDVFHFAANFIYMPWYPAFFSQKQQHDFHLKFASAVARSAADYAAQIRHGIIDANVSTHPIFTSINDPAVLQSLAQSYAIDPVDAAEIVNRGLFDEATTTVLYRIRSKDQAQ